MRRNEDIVVKADKSTSLCPVKIISLLFGQLTEDYFDIFLFGKTGLFDNDEGIFCLIHTDDVLTTFHEIVVEVFRVFLEKEDISL